MPAGQGEHAGLPSPSAKFPGSHSSQAEAEVAPVTLWAVPVGQRRQVVAALAPEYAPGGHGMHSVAFTATVPALHGAHSPPPPSAT